jgi:hypothetical protein
MVASFMHSLVDSSLASEFIVLTRRTASPRDTACPRDTTCPCDARAA